MIIGLFSCNFPESDMAETPQVAIPSPAAVIIPTKAPAPAGAVQYGDLIQPENLAYLGAFRLPEGSGGSNWEYSGHGLTYFSNGDPSGPEDGFQGSLFGFGHDHHLQVSEISIPVPVLSRDLFDLNTAGTLQPFSDITGGIFNPPEMTIPRAGIAYLAQPEPGLHFTFGQHIQDFEASHGWNGLNLADPQAHGPWFFDRYTNYITNDYLFDVPPAWAEANLPGALLASGRAREGLWSGRGPALFVYNPWDHGALPESGAALSATPLLLYGLQDEGIPDIRGDESMAVADYRDADHWWGGAWLTSGDRAAVVFVGTKALGQAWYGYANGVVWEHDCAEDNSCPEMPEWPYDNRGFWADDYQAQVIFYDPAQLAAVARGEMETWEPQPYATLVLDEFLFDPQLDHANYKRDLVGAAAFDREHGLLYIIERMADEYKSVIHVWQVGE
jgi:hypothetical protein